MFVVGVTDTATQKAKNDTTPNSGDNTCGNDVRALRLPPLVLFTLPDGGKGLVVVDIRVAERPGAVLPV